MTEFEHRSSGSEVTPLSTATLLLYHVGACQFLHENEVIIMALSDMAKKDYNIGSQTPPSPKLSTILFPKLTSSSTSSISSTYSIEAIEEDTQPQVLVSADATFCVSSKDDVDDEKIIQEPESSALESTFVVPSKTFSVLPSLRHHSLAAGPVLKLTENEPLSYSQFVNIPTNLVAADHVASNSMSSFLSPHADVADVPSTMEISLVQEEEESNNAGLNSTVVLSTDDEGRGKTFVVPSIVGGDDKENVMTSKFLAPIAKVSPMTSYDVAKAKNVMKKTTLNRPIASTSNLRSILDLKPAAQKTRFVYQSLFYCY